MNHVRGREGHPFVEGVMASIGAVKDDGVGLRTAMRKFNSWWWLQGLGCLLLLSLAGAAERRPNFLFIFTDDQRWDAMGVVQREQVEQARFPWLRTPAMDRLATEGVRFRNAFDTLSLCSPSRAALLTGRYNHLNGVIDNRTPFRADQGSYAKLLTAAGYRTAYFGKWHMGRQAGQRPGFDHSASFIGQGKYNDCPFEINGVMTPTRGWVDDVSTDLAIRWLKKKHEKPFMMVVGFKSPHSPRGGKNLPDRLRDLYAGETSRAVPNLGVPPIFRKPDPKSGKFFQGLVDQEVHLDYMRHVTGADQNLGRLLGALDDLDLSEDTVVIYSSDNGYYLGEHCSGDKRSLYEESIRIPLLVRYPRLFAKGAVVDEMVLNIDLAPTLLDLAGVVVPAEMQGASWRPLAEGKRPKSWRQSFFAEYYKELGGVPTLYGVRTKTHKLIVYPGHPEWTELFDLKSDPYEVKNLAADSELSVRLHTELERLAKEVRYRAKVK